jgi:hypothetical protein
MKAATTLLVLAGSAAAGFPAGCVLAGKSMKPTATGLSCESLVRRESVGLGVVGAAVSAVCCCAAAGMMKSSASSSKLVVAPSSMEART